MRCLLVWSEQGCIDFAHQYEHKAKTGEFTATNSTISLPIIGAMSGTDPAYATVSDALTLPMILTVSTKTGIALPGITDSGSSNEVVVYSIGKNGTLGDKYTAGTDYSISAMSGTETCSHMTITKTTTDAKWIIKYKRTLTDNAVRIANRSDAFPKTVKLTLKVLIVDPCEPDVVRAAYVVLPSFQPSADIEFSLSTDATLDFSGTLQTSYCGTDKILYEVLVCSDDEEDAA